MQAEARSKSAESDDKKHGYKGAVGRQGQQGLLCWPYKKSNCVKNVFIDYLGIIFICGMIDPWTLFTGGTGECFII